MSWTLQAVGCRLPACELATGSREGRGGEPRSNTLTGTLALQTRNRGRPVLLLERFFEQPVETTVDHISQHKLRIDVGSRSPSGNSWDTTSKQSDACAVYQSRHKLQLDLLIAARATILLDVGKAVLCEVTGFGHPATKGLGSVGFARFALSPRGGRAKAQAKCKPTRCGRWQWRQCFVAECPCASRH